MKKVFFFICIILAIIFFADLLIKVIRDFSRLTDYGWGYLAGKFVLVLVFTFAAVLLFRSSFKNKQV